MTPEPHSSLLNLPLEILREITTLVHAQDETFANERRQLVDKASWGSGTDAPERIRAMDLLKTTSKWYGRSLWSWSMTCKRLRDMSEKERYQTVTLQSTDCDYYISDIHPRYAHHFETLILDKVFGAKIGSTRWTGALKDYEACLRTLLPLSSNFNSLKALRIVDHVAARTFIDLLPPPAESERFRSQRESPDVKIMRAAFQKLYMQVTELALESVDSADLPFFMDPDKFRRVSTLEVGPAREEHNFSEYGPVLAKISGLKKLVLSRRVGVADGAAGIPNLFVDLNWKSLQRTLTELNFATSYLEQNEWSFIVHLGSQVTSLSLDLDFGHDSLAHVQRSSDIQFENLQNLSITAPHRLIDWLWKQFDRSPLISISLGFYYDDLRIDDGALASPFLQSLSIFVKTLRHVSIESIDVALEDTSVGVIRDYVATINKEICFVPRNFNSVLWEPIWEPERNGTDKEARSQLWQDQGKKKKKEVEGVLEYVRDQLELAEASQDTWAIAELAKLTGVLLARKAVGTH